MAKRPSCMQRWMFFFISVLKQFDKKKKNGLNSAKSILAQDRWLPPRRVFTLSQDYLIPRIKFFIVSEWKIWKVDWKTRFFDTPLQISIRQNWFLEGILSFQSDHKYTLKFSTWLKWWDKGKWTVMLCLVEGVGVGEEGPGAGLKDFRRACGYRMISPLFRSGWTDKPR